MFVSLLAFNVNGESISFLFVAGLKATYDNLTVQFADTSKTIGLPFEVHHNYDLKQLRQLNKVKSLYCDIKVISWIHYVTHTTLIYIVKVWIFTDVLKILVEYAEEPYLNCAKSKC